MGPHIQFLYSKMLVTLINHGSEVQPCTQHSWQNDLHKQEKVKFGYHNHSVFFFFNQAITTEKVLVFYATKLGRSLSVIVRGLFIIVCKKVLPENFFLTVTDLCHNSFSPLSKIFKAWHKYLMLLDPKHHVTQVEIILQAKEFIWPCLLPSIKQLFMLGRLVMCINVPL